MESKNFSTFGKDQMPQFFEKIPFKQTFSKFCHDGNEMSKQEFKLAFLYTFGVKPSKDDLEVVKTYLLQTCSHSEFVLNEEQFS